MSEYQFTLYEKIRKDEADKEKRMRLRKKRNRKLANLVSYRIFAFFVILHFRPPWTSSAAPKQEPSEEETGEKEEHEIDENELDAINDPNSEYEQIETALMHLKSNSADYLIPDKLNNIV